MKRVAIVPTIRKEQDIVYTKLTIAEFLKHGAELWMDSQYRDVYESEGVRFADADTVYQNSDLIVVLGGDGTIMHTAQSALNLDLPLLGINLGRLGYMAELEKNEIQLIEKIYTGQYTVEKRMTITAGVLAPDGAFAALGDALNDVVIGRGGYTGSIDMLLKADGKNVRTIRSDGLIICTPTGSTAYSMSAGGSVLDPTLECICATPICPISRYACPIVFSGDSVLEVAHADDRVDAWSIVVDGEQVHTLKNGETLVVKRSDKVVKMLSVKDEGFFETLNNKISKYELKS